jgi:hypothetical protein
MNEDNGAKKFIEHMLRHSVRLVRNARSVYDKPQETGLASAIMVQRPHALVLLTAGHTFWQPGDWTFETNVAVAGETLSFRLPGLQQLVHIDRDLGKAEMIDVAWARIDPNRVQAVLAKIKPRRRRVVTFHTYRGPLDKEPDPESAYGYAAWNLGWLDANLRKYIAEPSFEIGMKYVGRTESGLLKFQLARPHQGDAYYQGASGSAIADEEGTVVSILLAGDKEQNLLYGLDLKRYAQLLDATTQ